MINLQMFYLIVAVAFVLLQGPFYYLWHNLPKTCGLKRLSEVLLNTVGSIIGWSATYFLLFYRLQTPLSISSLTIADLVIFLIAVYGMTGYLPYILIQKLKLGN